MSTRTVTYTILRPDGTPWPFAKTSWQNLPGSFDGDANYPSYRFEDTADANGAGAVQLWANEEGAIPSVHRVSLPSGETADFTLPAGEDPIDLTVLRALGVINQDWTQELLSTAILNNPDIFPGEGGPLQVFGVGPDGKGFYEPEELALMREEDGTALWGVIGALSDAIEQIPAIPDPSAEADGRILVVEAGGLVYGDQTGGGGGGATELDELTDVNVAAATDGQFLGRVAGVWQGVILLVSHISDFAAGVRGVVLTGLSLATSTAITAADSVLVALGKLQAQVTLRATAADLAAHTGSSSNPHSVTKAQVGLGNADNTSDANKPISTAAQAALDLKADLVGGKIQQSQLPALAIGETFSVASQAAMLALTAQIGDVAIRTDQSNSRYLLTGTATTLADWKILEHPADAVGSVFGRTGNVTAQNGDYTGSNITNVPAGDISSTDMQAAINELDTEKQSIAGLAAAVRAVVLTGLSLATNQAIAAGDTILQALGYLQKQITDHLANTANPHSTTASQVGLGNVTNDAQAKADFSGYSAKTTPVDADTSLINDSAASGAVKKVTWANIKATLKTYFDTLYVAKTTFPWQVAVACSDETTALTAGTAKATFRLPYAMTVTAVFASVTTAPTGSTLIVDINEAGTSILSTKLSIDATEKSSDTAASAAVISDAALAQYAEITIDIDQVGSTVAGAGLKVWIIGTISV